MGPSDCKVALVTGEARIERGGQASPISTRITGEGSEPKEAGWRECPTNVEIAELAYRWYEARGRQDGHDVEDWLGAERALAWQYTYYGQSS